MKYGQKIANERNVGRSLSADNDDKLADEEVENLTTRFRKSVELDSDQLVSLFAKKLIWLYWHIRDRNVEKCNWVFLLANNVEKNSYPADHQEYDHCSFFNIFVKITCDVSNQIKFWSAVNILSSVEQLEFTESSNLRCDLFVPCFWRLKTV